MPDQFNEPHTLEVETIEVYRFRHLNGLEFQGLTMKSERKVVKNQQCAWIEPGYTAMMVASEYAIAG